MQTLPSSSPHVHFLLSLYQVTTEAFSMRRLAIGRSVGQEFRTDLSTSTIGHLCSFGRVSEGVHFLLSRGWLNSAPGGCKTGTNTLFSCWLSSGGCPQCLQDKWFDKVCSRRAVDTDFSQVHVDTAPSVPSPQNDPSDPTLSDSRPGCDCYAEQTFWLLSVCLCVSCHRPHAPPCFCSFPRGSFSLRSAPRATVHRS